MKWEELFLFAYAWLLFLTVWIPSSLIKGYIRHKPFGLQTVYDCVIVDVTRLKQFGYMNFCHVIVIGLVIPK